MTEPAERPAPSTGSETKLRPFTPEWGSRFCEIINGDLSFRDAARGWTWPLALVLEKNAELGYPEDVALRLALDAGRCGGATIVDAAKVDAPFKFRASYPVWKRIVRGELEPIAAVMRRELAFEGSLTTIVMQVRTIHALVACAQQVPTDFPDE